MINTDISICSSLCLGKHKDIIIYFIKVIPDEFKEEFDTYKELHMLSVKTVDVIFRVESSVHNELGLSEAKDIKILKKVFYRLGIGDVPGELAVVKG